MSHTPGNLFAHPAQQFQLWKIAALISAIALLHGCGTAPTATTPTPVPEKVYKNPEDNPQYWYQRTQQEISASGNYVTIKTQPITENWPDESLRWSLRTITTSNSTTHSKTPVTDQLVHQLYFHIRYKGDMRDYHRAELDKVVPKRITPLSKGTGSCQYGCIFSEDFTISLTTEELKNIAEREETRVSLTGTEGDKPTLLLLPGPYLKGHWQKLIEEVVIPGR